MDEDSIVALNSVQGIEYVRPPTLDFLKVKENGDYTEYKIITKKNASKIKEYFQNIIIRRYF